MKVLKIKLEKISEWIKYLGDGKHKCGWFKGWIEIEGNKEFEKVMWGNRKNSSVSIQYFYNHIGIIYKSKLIFHPFSSLSVEKQEEKGLFLDFLNNKILKAFVLKRRIRNLRPPP